MKTENKKTNIPEGWTMRRLGDVAILSKLGWKPGNRDFKYIGLEHINKGDLTINSYGFSSKLESNKFYFKRNDVLFGKLRPYFRKVWKAKFDGVCSTDIWVIRSKEGNSQDFIFYFFANPEFINKSTRGSIGTKMPRADWSYLQNLEYNFPSLPEQQAIADVLSSLDDKIELLREQNKTLEAIAQAIYKRWFVDFEFPIEEGNTLNSPLVKEERQPKTDGMVFNTLQRKGYKSSGGKMIESELGEIPEGWRVGTVNDVIERFYITYRCNQKDLSQNGKTPILDQGSNGLYGYTERSPDFQASIENPVIVFANHTCYIWFINYPFCAIQNVIPFRGNKEYSVFFVFYMTFGQVKFIEYKGHWPDFEQKKYAIPKPKIANKFAEIIKSLQYSIWNNNAQIQTLSALRDSLLPKLMSGKIRVPTTPSCGHPTLKGGELEESGLISEKDEGNK